MESFLPFLLGAGALYFLITGLVKIIKQKTISYKWKYERPNYAVRDDVEISGAKAVFRGIIRLVIGVIFIFMMLQVII